MAELAALFSVFKELPVEASLILTAVFVLTTLWLNSRKVDVESLTSVSKLQVENMQHILNQNKELAEELHKVRQSQAFLHSEIESLRAQNTRMYKHIMSLERLVQFYHPKCSGCPERAGEIVPEVPDMPFKYKE